METRSPVETLDAKALSDLITHLLRGVERGSRQWTVARRKESLRRMLDDVRGNGAEMRVRLMRLVATWSASDQDEPPEPRAADAAAASAPTANGSSSPAAPAVDLDAWRAIVGSLGSALAETMPAGQARAQSIANDLAALREQLASAPVGAAQVESAEALSVRARRLLQQRLHLADQSQRLCTEFAESLVDLAEDDSWARGQCEVIRQTVAEGLNARNVRSISSVLHHTRERQRKIRNERGQARDALRSMIQRMLSEVGELGQHTGRFSTNVTHYAEVIEHAESIESLASTVQAMIEESAVVTDMVAQTQTRIHDEHARATELTDRVKALEDELRRLSDEVSTDALTGVANRRGLQAAFQIEKARCDRSGRPLAIGLIDLDNFKRLNDTLGHSAGDQALVALAKRVEAALRPTDKVARYGGEEFVVLLPETELEEAQNTLTRLQRLLTQSLFMHEQQQVFVTFSAGVTLYRSGERLDDALERADESLYEAKRSGKNRTCVS